MSETPTQKRKPRTEEQKAAARTLYASQRAELEASAIRRSTKFDRFIYKFLQALIINYDHVLCHGVDSVEAKHDKLKFKQCPKGDIYISLSAVWLRAEYGPKALEFFRRLFKQVQQGGVSRTGERFDTLWVANEEVYSTFHARFRKAFKQKLVVDPAEVWEMVADATVYKRGYTQHTTVVNDKGRLVVIGSENTKRMHPASFFMHVRASKKAMVQAANDGNARAAVEKPKRIIKQMIELATFGEQA